MARQRLPDDLTARRAGLLIAAVTATVALVGGVLMRALDPHEFPSIGSGLWFAVQTITTVGYGDHVPRSGGGRVLSVLVMLSGIGFISVFTASISAVFVESARRRRRSREEVSLEHVAERLDRIERRLDEISGRSP